MLLPTWFNDAPEVVAAKQKVRQRRKMLAFAKLLSKLVIRVEKWGMSRKEIALILLQQGVSINMEK
jgi:hypothetical protein